MSELFDNLPEDVKKNLNISGEMEKLKSAIENADTTDTEETKVEEVIVNTVNDVTPTITSVDTSNEEVVKSNIIPNQPEENVDISDIAESVMAMEESSISSVLGNLDEDDEDSEEISPSIQYLLNKQKENSLINENSIESFDDEEDDTKKGSQEAFNEEALSEETKSYKTFENAKRNVNSKLQFMDNIKVDLNNIILTEKPALKQIEDTNIIFESAVSTFFVTCCQSGYSATLSGLTLAEKNAINNSNLDLFQSKQKLYKTVYNKIQTMNFAKPKFDDWLKLTSMGDWNTLLFGIYCQTFIDNNDFDITCGECGKTTSVTVDNMTLVEVKDKNIYARIEEIVGSNKTPQDLIENSILSKTTRVLLNDSKIIVDIKTPSLWDNLALIKSTNPNTLREYSDTFSAMLFIKKMYMLDVQNTYESGKPYYYEIKEKAKILDTLLQLSNNDGEQLEDLIEEKLGVYNINYEIHNCKCAHCKKTLPNIPVDMETILFTRINKERKRKTTN